MRRRKLKLRRWLIPGLACACACAPTTAQAQAPALSKAQARKHVTRVFPSVAPSMLLQDERSRIYVTEKLHVERAKECTQVNPNTVDCAFTLQFTGLAPEVGETPVTSGRTLCEGELRVRRWKNGPLGYTMRTRAYTCEFVTNEQLGPLPTP